MILSITHGIEYVIIMYVIKYVIMYYIKLFLLPHEYITLNPSACSFCFTSAQVFSREW